MANLIIVTNLKKNLCENCGKFKEKFGNAIFV